MNRPARPRPALAALALVLLVAHPARAQTKPPLPAWTPDPVLAKKLGAEAKFDGWSIRPPAGYKANVREGGPATTYAWDGPGGRGFGVTVMNRQAGDETPEQAFESALKGLKGTLRNVQAKPAERGLVNGRAFLRTRFTAETLTSKSLVHGFVYLTFDAPRPMIVQSYAGEASVKPLEASALTLKITAPAAAPAPALAKGSKGSEAGAKPAAPAGRATGWTPEPDALKGLADVQTFDTWSIRPPAGYKHLAFDNKAAKGKSYNWIKPPISSMVILVTDEPTRNTVPPEMVVKFMRDGFGPNKPPPGMKFAPEVETGRINGLAFARGRFTMEAPNVQGVHNGIMYVTTDSPTPTIFYVVADDGDDFRTLEASVLTYEIRKP